MPGTADHSLRRLPTRQKRAPRRQRWSLEAVISASGVSRSMAKGIPVTIPSPPGQVTGLAAAVQVGAVADKHSQGESDAARYRADHRHRIAAPHEPARAASGVAP